MVGLVWESVSGEKAGPMNAHRLLVDIFACLASSRRVAIRAKLRTAFSCPPPGVGEHPAATVGPAAVRPCSGTNHAKDPREPWPFLSCVPGRSSMPVAVLVR